MMKLAVFGSGRGSNFKAILEAIDIGTLTASVSVVVVNNPDAKMKQLAEEKNIPVISIDSKLYSREEHENEIMSKLIEYDIDLIILAGYMRVLSNTFVSQFENQILNIHPSLLPSFPGLNAHKQALDQGVKVSGVTVHLVNSGVDEGLILAQRCVPVFEDDTEEKLSQRILKIEHAIYAETIQKIISGKIKLPISKVM